MKIVGLFSGHDCSYCILNDGIPEIHDEYERFIRQKEPYGDSAQFFFNNYSDSDNVDYVVTCHPYQNIKDYRESFSRLKKIIDKNSDECYCVGHHQAHAANAFF